MNTDISSPPLLSLAWVLGTLTNLAASAAGYLPRWARSIRLDRTLEKLCVRHDWRDEPLF